MEYHPLVKEIVEILTKKGFWFETFQHEPVRTSEEAIKTRPGYTLQQGAKALILRLKKINGEKLFAMIVIPGDKRFNNEKAKQIFQAKDIRFATEDEVYKITNGVKPGGVPPFGNLFKIPIYVDTLVFQNERIVFNAGDKSFSIAMKSKDYKNSVNPIVVNII